MSVILNKFSLFCQWFWVLDLELDPTYRYYLNGHKGNVWTIGAGASDKRKEKCKNRCNNEAASGIKMPRLVANL